ncbi:MAG: SDR family oxidoreductase [Coriobacteriaceae bacterium]|nr:SDR family oxidoreductase [Coriobacteriaceae bacterium]
MADRLKGKCAVVTGAASGLGKAIALAYLREGAKVLGADINQTRLEELQGEVEAAGYGDSFRWAICNVTKTEDCYNAVKACADAFGTCNVLSNNAGIVCSMAMVHNISDEEWDRVVGVNMTGTMKMCRAALKYFVENDVKGTIVLTTSDAVHQAATGGPTYVASKNGAQGLVKAIAFEYGRRGIRCNSFGPGGFMSNISESMGGWDPEGGAIHMGAYNKYKGEWALRELCTVDGLANISVFLASEESENIQGAFILANSGISLG